MDKFIVDGNNQKIVRVKDDMPANVPYNPAYAAYEIPFSDINGLIDVLKSKGDIKQETSTVNTTTISAVYDKPEQIINTQANIIDKQLNIIQTLMTK